jgi:hypothetical protein
LLFILHICLRPQITGGKKQCEAALFDGRVKFLC